MPNRCSGCDVTWTGRAQCHCGVCHETFSGLEFFDAHRPAGKCLVPSEVRGRGGYRTMWLHGGIWHGTKTPPNYEALAKARVARS